MSACVALLAAGCTPGQPAPPPAAGPSLASDAAGNGTLVLYDVDNGYGELYAMEVANLVSRFGTWRAVPVSRYAKGDNAHYAAVVYIGSATDGTLPGAFLDDVLTARTPTLWLNQHIDQLTARRPGVAARLGFTTRGTTRGRSPRSATRVSR